ncbi:MAG: hypothetical protein R3C20_12350 [Planctomycetaceae bacterium]
MSRHASIRQIAAGIAGLCCLVTLAVIVFARDRTDEVSAAKVLTDVYSQEHRQWASDLPPELFQENSGSPEEESISALATIPQLIQDSLRGRPVITMEGN